MMRPLNFHPFPILKTPRLLLRALIHADAPALFQYQSDKRNFPFVDMPVYQELTEAEDYIASRHEGIKKNQYIIWAIADRQTDRIIGTISLWNFNLEDARAEYGYGLFPGNHGRGIMTEALQSIETYGVKILGLHTIEAYTHEENQKSQKLLERTGYRFQETVIEHDTPMAIYRKHFT